MRTKTKRLILFTVLLFTTSVYTGAVLFNTVHTFNHPLMIITIFIMCGLCSVLYAGASHKIVKRVFKECEPDICVN